VADDAQNLDARNTPLSGGDPSVRLHAFRNQPRWVVAALIVIVIAAATLYTADIGSSGLSTYYAASVKSMLENSRAVLFGAFDPNATITLDKLAGFLLPQALSAKIFGFSPWSLALPQALEGVITIVASYVIGSRWRGRTIGLSIAALMAFTPMLAAMFGRPMEDGLLTMCMVLAFAAWQRALVGNGAVWLLVCGFWVAVGFQAKMLEAWMILPALLIAYIIASPVPMRRRIGRLVGAGAVTLVLSLSWMTAIQLVPASQRPYIDGTTSNNTYSMVFGYNGLDRLVPGLVPGAVPQLSSLSASGQFDPAPTESAGMSPAKLLLPQFTTQLGWLYPAAVAGCVLEVRALWRRGRRKTNSGGVSLALILWLVFTGLVMSIAFVPHTTYLAVLALPLAALAVAGAAGCAKLYRGRARAWITLPIAVVVQTVWAAAIALSAAAAMQWLAPVILVTGLAASGVLVALRVHPVAPKTPLRAAIAAAVVAAAIGPVTWSLCVLGPGGGGSASDAFAGPRLVTPKPDLARHAISTVHAVGSDAGLDPQQRRLVDYVETRNEPGGIAFATDTMDIAVRVILTTNENPIAMGGFSGQAPTPTLSSLRRLIESGRLRFVLLAVTAPDELGPVNTAVDADRRWVHANCAPVLTGRFREGKIAHQTLFDCAVGSRKKRLGRS
jgi:4-amino-4-deoxy-L-arabinose transferase-like glycosyltransferase